MGHPFDLGEVDRLLTTTRSVRKRLDLTRDVPLDLVRTCLDIAQQAPTGSNSRSYRWLVVTDPDRRAALAAIYRKGLHEYAKATSRMEERGFESQAEADCDRVRALDAQTHRVFKSARYLTEHLHEVPVHVVPCLLGRIEAGDSNFMAAAYYGSVLPAVWSFMLALRARGLGSVFTTLHLANEHEAAEVLDIPSHVTQVGLVPVAYYTGRDFGPATRGSIDEVLFVNEWGAR
jgi:nitroreductase